MRRRSAALLLRRAELRLPVDVVKASLEEGYTCECYAFTDSNDVAAVCPERVR